jgi:hypothetical protein
MAMLAIYCDDSGTDKTNRSAVVAGYLSSVAQWELFIKEWEATLKGFKVKQMHRSDLETFNGEYTQARGWNPDRRKAFLQRLQPIITRRTKLPIGTAVIRKDYDEIVPEQVRAKFGGVYGWCAHTCLVKLRIWCDRKCRRHQNPIEWVFEAGTIGHGQVHSMFDELYGKQQNGRDWLHNWRIKRWSFQGKDTVPLQAADVLAYEVFKLVENQILDNSKKHDVRQSMRHLMGANDGRYLDFWDRERLKKWVTSHESQFDKFVKD